MSFHYPVYKGDARPYTCVCGSDFSGNWAMHHAEADLRRHITDANEQAALEQEAEKERVRLLTQGQNWDMP